MQHDTDVIDVDLVAVDCRRSATGSRSPSTSLTSTMPSISRGGSRPGSASRRSASSCTPRAGPEAIERLRALDFAVFADLKLHDIPTTVERAARVLGGLGVGVS